MKTAVTLLQELMVKRGEAPEFECIAQSGPAHSAVFEYRCRALGADVVAAARSKRDAKQEAARRMLLALAAAGALPPEVAAAAATLPAAPPPPAAPAATTAAPDVAAAAAALPAPEPAPPLPPDPSTKPYVALLKELCEEYRLGGVEWAVVGDAGPAHARQFTLAARLGGLERRATAPTKKAARQAAAELLYHYLRANLNHLTADFVESEALARAHERTMERYVELRDAQLAPSARPPLAACVAEYHLALARHAAAAGAAARGVALAALERGGAGAAHEACAALGLRVERDALGEMHATRAVGGVWPPPTALRLSADAADAALCTLLRRALRRAETLQTLIC